MNNNDWSTPMLNSLKGTDAAALRQIFRELTNEIQRLNAEIGVIKDSQNISASTGILKLR